MEFNVELVYDDEPDPGSPSPDADDIATFIVRGIEKECLESPSAVVVTQA